MNILQHMLDAVRMDKTPWYKRKFVSIPRVNFNAKYPQRHQGAKECARRQRQRERAEEKAEKKQMQQEYQLIDALQKDGHTHHCACRLVWGDGECECNKRGYILGRASRIIEAARSAAT